MGAVSATWPDAVRRLAATFQKDPVRVTIGSDDLTANARVAQGQYPNSALLFFFWLIRYSQSSRSSMMTVKRSTFIRAPS